MRLSLRFIVPLVLALGAIAYGVAPLVDDLTLKWFVRDLDIRTKLIAAAVQEPLADAMTADLNPSTRQARIESVFGRIIQDERLFAIGYCNASGKFAYRTVTLPRTIACRPPGLPAEEAGRVHHFAGGSLHVANNPVLVDGTRVGELVIVHDMSFVERRSADTKKYIVYLFAGIGAVIALITVVIAELSWRGWVAGIKALIRGQLLAQSPEPRAKELKPIARDLEALVRDLEAERRMRDESQMTWVPETLRTILREDLKGDEILIVSNREPYIHVRQGGRIDVLRPASGLVTRAGARDARLLGHLDRPRGGQRRPRGGRPAGPRAGAAREALLPDPPRLAHEGGGGGLLLRLRERGPVAAVPHRPHAPGVPRLATGSTTAR